jgi:hypothetical protein
MEIYVDKKLRDKLIKNHKKGHCDVCGRYMAKDFLQSARWGISICENCNIVVVK